MTTAIRVSEKGAKGLRSGEPWCYRTELLDVVSEAPKSAVVDVLDKQKNFIGQALYARTSPIALRLLTRARAQEERIDDAFFVRRLERAWERRRTLHPRDAFRVVHGEADLLPGLFVDRYGSVLVLQTLSEGLDARKEMLAAALVKISGCATVVCRDDGSGRDFEGLPREKKVLVGAAPGLVGYHEGENRFVIDVMADAKTGSFLDQVDNHLRAGELASGTALDLFSYHGGFALALSRSCVSVHAVEQDETAAGRIKTAVAENGRSNVTVECGNAFDVLRNYEREGRQFDTVVIDPPGLAKRKEGLKTAMRAYHELNLRALKLLKPEGLLVSCSCSGKLTRQAFEEMILGAAKDAKRSLQVLERRGAGIDHPPLLGLPQTEYLKAWFVRAL
ncbi:MAG: class I SAM-dependent rRNA methyltransferase [Myxococcaceae bacterium]|nr:class I SAM-dependent rRNA methyltransferase [Myxococcaceae bacterium]